ncbi:polysaccharide pyruvyl transferase family protein [Halomonas mongoliensis]|uniref:polysaccharide pyruvyl transferase family protein n=1 Tax=Halomonas mongoliensis TaxID=321265 RepID=UPI00403AB435
MKKIGILNFQYSTHNYGAVLQAAALEHICTQLGHEAQHLDYMAKRKVTLKGRVGQVLRKLGLRNTPAHARVANEEAFERFRERFITRTKKIRNPSEFRSVAKGFDSVIVGSDQVWRPAFAKDTLGFFLGHVPEGVDRLSYAASFGTSSWEKSNDAALTDKVKKELHKFKAVSCREESGVEICRDVFGVEAEHVLDPLLLVDDGFFEKLIGKAGNKNNAKMVFYKLDSDDDFFEDLGRLAKFYNFDYLNIYSERSDVRHYREVIDWLSYIRDAELVVSDSFHCICLALRFGKKVIYCPNERRGQARMDSLFSQLEISLVPVKMDLKTPLYELSRAGDIDSGLKKLRESSQRFLVNALEK